MDHITLADGRRLDFRVSGPDDGPLVVFHHGSPGAGTEFRAVERPAHDRGLRTALASRPGYGDSSRAAGRDVVDVVADTDELLDHLGVDDCVVAGLSGGGPHTLACAARLGRCRAALSVASLGPADGDGLDLMGGMGDDNVEGFEAAIEGEAPLRYLLQKDLDEMGEFTVAGFIESSASILPAVDVAVLTDELGQDLVATMTEAHRNGLDGAVDDFLAFVRPWGFALDEIEVPVSLWHGSVDLMVPFAHGRWLADNLPTATPHLIDGQGHISVLVGEADPMFDELVALADL